MSEILISDGNNLAYPAYQHPKLQIPSECEYNYKFQRCVCQLMQNPLLQNLVS